MVLHLGHFVCFVQAATARYLQMCLFLPARWLKLAVGWLVMASLRILFAGFVASLWTKIFFSFFFLHNNGKWRLKALKNPGAWNESVCTVRAFGLHGKQKLPEFFFCSGHKDAVDIISDMHAYCGQLYLTGPLLTPAPPASKIVWLEIQAYYAKWSICYVRNGAFKRYECDNEGRYVR